MWGPCLRILHLFWSFCAHMMFDMHARQALPATGKLIYSVGADGVFSVRDLDADAVKHQFCACPVLRRFFVVFFSHPSFWPPFLFSRLSFACAGPSWGWDFVIHSPRVSSLYILPPSSSTI